MATEQQQIPDQVMDLFQEPALGGVSYHNAKGEIVSWPMWVDYEDGRILTSSPAGSAKGKSFRQRPEVSVLIVSTKTPWHWLSLSGRVVDTRPDEGLAFIDKMSRKYTGGDYQRRTPREIFSIAIDHLSSSAGWG